ncbi:hypothetical protein Dimus_013426 [Dionaea muscipula]
MKRSTSGRGNEVEAKSKKSSAPRATIELNDPGTELSRPELASTSGKGIVVATKDTSAPESNSLEHVIHSVPDLARAER